MKTLRRFTCRKYSKSRNLAEQEPLEMRLFFELAEDGEDLQVLRIYEL